MTSTSIDSLEIRGQKELCEYLSQIAFNSKESADVVLVINAQEYHLHKILLSRAPYFRTLFSQRWKTLIGMKKSNQNDTDQPEPQASESNLNLNLNPNRVEISIEDPNVNHWAVKKTLEHIYGGASLPSSIPEALSLLSASCFFGLQTLSQLCENFILHQLSPENVSTCCKFFHRFCYGKHGDTISRACRLMLLRIVSTNQSLLLSIPTPVLLDIFASDSLCVPSEYDRYQLLVPLLPKILPPSSKLIVSPIVNDLIDSAVILSQKLKRKDYPNMSNRNNNNNNNSTSPTSFHSPQLSSRLIEVTSTSHQLNQDLNGLENQIDNISLVSKRKINKNKDYINNEEEDTSDSDHDSDQEERSILKSKQEEFYCDSLDNGQTCQLLEPSNSFSQEEAENDEQSNSSEFDGESDISPEDLKNQLISTIQFSNFSVQQLFKTRKDGLIPIDVLNEALWKKEYTRLKIMQATSIENEAEMKFSCDFFRICRLFPWDSCSVAGLNFSEPFSSFGSMWKLSAKIFKENGKNYVACFLYRTLLTSSPNSMDYIDSEPRNYEFSISILTPTGVVRKSSCRKFANDDSAENCNWGWNKFLKYTNLDEILSDDHLVISVKLRPMF